LCLDPIWKQYYQTIKTAEYGMREPLQTVKG
jgi:hypothetical protein